MGGEATRPKGVNDGSETLQPRKCPSTFFYVRQNQNSGNSSSSSSSSFSSESLREEEEEEEEEVEEEEKSYNQAFVGARDFPNNRDFHH